MTTVASRAVTINQGPKKVLVQLKMTARCLFGAPDPAQCDQLVAKVHETKRWAFERKWNFSVGNESQLAPENNNYQWEGPFKIDFGGRCDSEQARISHPGFPTRVPLLSAPIRFDELLPQFQDAPSSVSNTTEPSPDMDLTDSVSTETSPLRSPHRPHHRLRSSSAGKNGRHFPSSNSRDCKVSLAFEKDLCSRSPPGDIVLFPATKQKSITDYMKIKKTPPRMKKIR